MYIEELNFDTDLDYAKLTLKPNISLLVSVTDPGIAQGDGDQALVRLKNKKWGEGGKGGPLDPLLCMHLLDC